MHFKRLVRNTGPLWQLWTQRFVTIDFVFVLSIITLYLFSVTKRKWNWVSCGKQRDNGRCSFIRNTTCFGRVPWRTIFRRLPQCTGKGYCLASKEKTLSF